MARVSINLRDVNRAQESAPRNRGAWWEAAAPYVFIAPFFIGFMVFQFFPILFSAFLSAQDWNPYKPGIEAFKFIGLKNFTDLLHNDLFWNSLRNTAIITAVCIPIGTSLAILLAVLIDAVPNWLSNILRAIFFMPAVTSVVVISTIWKQLLSTEYGAINNLLQSLGMARLDFLGDAGTALACIIVVLIWAGLGWDSLIITSALRAIPEEYYEAAKLDGAGRTQEFWSITLPLLRPTITFVVTTGFIFLLGLFSQVQLLTGGNPVHRTDTLALYLYDQAFRQQKFGYASAIAVILTLIMFAVSYINFRFFSGDEEGA